MHTKQGKRMKFLIDENIPQSTASYLQSIDYNVKLGEPRKHDEYHYQIAHSEKRTLLTCDKDFLNRLKFSFHNCHCIIKLPSHSENTDSYFSALGITLVLHAPFADEFLRHKIEFKSSNSWVVLCPPGCKYNKPVRGFYRLTKKGIELAY